MDWRTGVAISATMSATTRTTTVSSMPCRIISPRTSSISSKGKADANFARAHVPARRDDAVETEVREGQGASPSSMATSAVSRPAPSSGARVVLALPDFGDGHDGIDLLGSNSLTASGNPIGGRRQRGRLDDERHGPCGRTLQGTSCRGRCSSKPRLLRHALRTRRPPGAAGSYVLVGGRSHHCQSRFDRGPESWTASAELRIAKGVASAASRSSKSRPATMGKPRVVKNIAAHVDNPTPMGVLAGPGASCLPPLPDHPREGRSCRRAASGRATADSIPGTSFDCLRTSR